MQPLKLLAVFGLSLATAGCAGNVIRTVSTDGITRTFKPIPNSSGAPCEMQRAVAAHNSAYDSLVRKREVVYKAPCDVDKNEQVTS